MDFVLVQLQMKIIKHYNVNRWQYQVTYASKTTEHKV